MNILHDGNNLYITDTSSKIKISNYNRDKMIINITDTSSKIKISNYSRDKMIINDTTMVSEIGKIVDTNRGIDNNYTWSSFTGESSSGSLNVLSSGSSSWPSGDTRTYWRAGDFSVYGIDGCYYMSGSGLIKESDLNTVDLTVDEMTELRLVLEEQWEEYFNECVWMPNLSGSYDHLDAFDIVGNIVKGMSIAGFLLEHCKISAIGEYGAYVVEMKLNNVEKVSAFDGKKIVSGCVKPLLYNHNVSDEVIMIDFSFHMYDMLTDSEKELYIRNAKIVRIRYKWFEKGIDKIAELVEWRRKEKVLRNNGCGKFMGSIKSLGDRISKELYGDIVMEMNEEIDGVGENS